MNPSGKLPFLHVYMKYMRTYVKEDEVWSHMCKSHVRVLIFRKLKSLNRHPSLFAWKEEESLESELFFYFKTMQFEAGELARWLRALLALAEHSSSMSSTTWCFIPCNTSSKDTALSSPVTPAPKDAALSTDFGEHQEHMWWAWKQIGKTLIQIK